MSDDLDIPAPTYRVPRHRGGMDPATRRLAIIAGSLGGALLLLIGGWSLMGHRSGGVPVIEADSGPLRVKPQNPGGMQVTGTNDEILSDGDGSVGKLAPAAEAPAPQDLKAATAPAVASAPPPPATTPAQPVPAAPPAAVAATPAKPPVSVPSRVAATARPAPEHPEARISGGKGTLVQLAALSSEEAAKTEWHRLEKRMPSLLGNRQPAVSRTEHDGKTYWRLRTGGFSDIAQATAFCEQVRAKGSGCTIAAF